MESLNTPHPFRMGFCTSYRDIKLSTPGTSRNTTYGCRHSNTIPNGLNNGFHVDFVRVPTRQAQSQSHDASRDTKTRALRELSSANSKEPRHSETSYQQLEHKVTRKCESSDTWFYSSRRSRYSRIHSAVILRWAFSFNALR